MKNKRKARVLALQLMYAIDMRGGDDREEIITAILETEEHNPESIIYAKALVARSIELCVSTDPLLQKHIANWDLKRLSAIDRNILRLAIAELQLDNDVPFKVIIDEAVEIAKEYGTDDSGKFVNGVIDSVYKEMKQNGDTKKE